MFGPEMTSVRTLFRDRSSGHGPASAAFPPGDRHVRASCFGRAGQAEREFPGFLAQLAGKAALGDRGQRDALLCNRFNHSTGARHADFFLAFVTDIIRPPSLSNGHSAKQYVEAIANDVVGIIGSATVAFGNGHDRPARLLTGADRHHQRIQQCGRRNKFRGRRAGEIPGDPHRRRARLSRWQPPLVCHRRIRRVHSL